MRELNMEESVWHKVNKLGFILSFTMFRVLYFQKLLRNLWNNADFNSVGTMVKYAVLGLYGLNLYWFAKIIKMALKR